MRLALLSDIHGNPIALDAVLADVAAQGGVDEYLVLGDLVALGYDPITVLQRLTSLPKVGFTCGNTDRYVVSGDRPATGDEATVVEMANSFSWTRGYITAGGWFDWLGALPLEPGPAGWLAPARCARSARHRRWSGCEPGAERHRAAPPCS